MAGTVKVAIFFPLKVVSTAKDCDTRAYTQYIHQEDENVNAKESYLTVAKLKKSSSSSRLALRP